MKLWKTFCDTFNCMPVAALISDRVFCMHGGIPSTLCFPNFSFNEIRNLVRPIPVVEGRPGAVGCTESKIDGAAVDATAGIVEDLLWADPAHGAPIRGYMFNETRKISHMFGSDALDKFMTKHDLDLIVRAHEVVDDGYRFFGAPERPMGLVTIFSAPNYTCVSSRPFYRVVLGQWHENMRRISAPLMSQFLTFASWLWRFYIFLPLSPRA